MKVGQSEISVSAVIPAYNAERFICEPIRSILEQTSQVSEIIVVDDGSSDRTAEVAAGFPLTRVIQRQNGGQAAARNTGIHAASGDWIAFLDHDDVWNPRKIELQLHLVGPNVGVIHAERFDPINFGILWHRQAHITPSGALVRRQTLLDVGGFEESRAVMGVEDLTLWLKIALTHWQIVKSPSSVFEWRQTGHNYSANEARMVSADLACIEFTGQRVNCQQEEIERLKQASRIEYAKNLVAGRKWNEAAQLLQQCTPGLASRWLSVARSLKLNHMARTNLVKSLHNHDAHYDSHVCSGECTLSEPLRRECMNASRKPYCRPPHDT